MASSNKALEIACLHFDDSEKQRLKRKLDDVTTDLERARMAAEDWRQQSFTDDGLPYKRLAHVARNIIHEYMAAADANSDDEARPVAKAKAKPKAKPEAKPKAKPKAEPKAKPKARAHLYPPTV